MLAPRRKPPFPNDMNFRFVANRMAAAVLALPSYSALAVDSPDFERDILPLLHQRCFSCHSEKKEKPKGGLRLDSAEEIRESGVMATEFGRSPKSDENTAGRGHHPAVLTWWVAGRGMKAGYVYGTSDEAAQRVAENPVTMPDFNATIALALGINLEKVHHSPSARPFTVSHKGKPIMDLFA